MIAFEDDFSALILTRLRMRPSRFVQILNAFAKGGVLPLVLLTLSTIYQQVAAQQAPERYHCDFQETSTKERLRLEFIYDRPRDKALIIGNNGTSDVTAFTGTDLITFLEYLSSGAVQTTSIDRRGSAVHSRHTYTNTFLQSQWTGVCN